MLVLWQIPTCQPLETMKKWNSGILEIEGTTENFNGTKQSLTRTSAAQHRYTQ